MSAHLAIETRALSKHYGSVRAVDDLSLRVGEGEIYAFLGLNGAGKTTTIRMLLGMIRPTSGDARVLGTPVRLGSVMPWASVGYLVETPHAYPELTVTENLEVARRLHPGTPKQAISEIIERLALTEYADRRAGTLSLGNAQRLGLAKALLHKPRLLLLDEPANGLDPAGIVEIRHLLQELSQQGVTIFMSSHILGEVARLAQRIGIIHGGRLLQEMDIDELNRNRRRWLRAATRDNAAACAVLERAGHRVEPGVNGFLTLSAPAAVDHSDDVARLLVEAGTPPTQLIVDEEQLEPYFLRLIGIEEPVQ
jgi:ABC-2 type transport system ATP-binding protein